MADKVSEDELKPTPEYAQLDAEDESLARWKASLGIVPGASGGAATGPKLKLHSLSLVSATAPNGAVTLDLESGNAEAIKKDTLTIKEGVEYHVSFKFTVGQEVLSGLRFIQVVKRGGIPVDKTEAMIGSFSPRGEPYIKHLETEEAPSGMLARATYSVRSRLIDDDNQTLWDQSWSFKIAKDWAA
ncbi:Rho GDP-dissociation inhibitor [Ceraceosorus bombacis]|uniref:Rho GDP-dissociation inhibitor n=1 Tax=Ceraceosorus bombacis TaxID=401625 RepID=A0A0P1BES8_9BASI|nr:Rho GDP-dissociation inhibitor [Ceraceosorus bombacis]